MPTGLPPARRCTFFSVDAAYCGTHSLHFDVAGIQDSCDLQEGVGRSKPVERRRGERVEAARDRVGMLCDQLSRWPDLPGIIRDAGAGSELDELIAALGSEELPDQGRVIAWVQAIDDACARHGLAGLTSRENPFRPLPIGLSEDAGPRAWVCPRGHCNRVVLYEEKQTPPVCVAGGGTPMRRFGLPPS